jgi:predicted nucleic acid-binding protein
VADGFEVVTAPALLGELERALQYPAVREYLETSQHEVDAFTE